MIELTFNNEGDFNALNAARHWCEENRISYGSLCRDAPICLLYGDFAIAKWKNLTPAERLYCHGTMTGDFRNGPVTIRIIERPETQQEQP